MAAGYVDNPHNFDQIEPYVIVSKKQIVQEIMATEKCYFYDACSFRKHVQMIHPEYLFDFVKKFQGVVVITRCILMELASYSGMLNTEYIEYIKKMHRAGLKILVVYEEDFREVMDMCFSTNAVINKYLSLAVKTVKTPTGTVESTLKGNKALLTEIIIKCATDSGLFSRFFQEVRNNKESKDNLGEELIAICLHLLSAIPESCEYKYVVMTEDKGAIGLLKKAAKNIYEHRQVRCFSALTTAKLAQRLYEERIISQKSQVEEVLTAGNTDGMVKILGSEEYDLEPKEKTVTCNELAQKIVTPNAIHINY